MKLYFLSLALVCAHNQRMPTIDVIFERYKRIFVEKKNIHYYYYIIIIIIIIIIIVCIYLLT